MNRLTSDADKNTDGHRYKDQKEIRIFSGLSV
jgi:hypothetical protein